jgi:peptidoglycan/xylan/chitin deacetylase (PgdA/CDA1 family)
MVLKLFSPLLIGCISGCLILSTLLFSQYGQQDRGPADGKNFQWPEGKRLALSLTFDDARASQLDNGIPLLDRHQVKATFYVSPAGLKERLDDWRSALAAGHEIGNHSFTHPCTGNFLWSREKALENHTLESIALDIDKASQNIKASLGMLPRTFAYPCGQKFVGRGQEVKSYVPVVAERFLVGRGWLDESPNDPGFCDLSQVMAMELDGLRFDQAKALIDQAAVESGWLVFCGHDIGDPARQTVLTTTLESICEYAADPSSGIWIDTVASVARHIKGQRGF